MPSSFNTVVLDVLRLRSAATRITAGKLTNALASVSPDGRLRDAHVYYGAGPGRFSGRKVQLQNLPRGVDAKFLNVEAFFDRGPMTWGRLETYRSIAEHLSGKPVSVADMVSTFIRPCLTAAEGKTLLVCDYTAIELCALAWVSGQDDLVTALRNGDDIYRKMAAVLYKINAADVNDVQRWVGKQIILGCGYQMSGSKFELMCAGFGVKLADAGVTGNECVEAYRSSYPRIAGDVAGVYNDRPYRRGGIWHRLGDAVLSCVADDGSHTVGRCVVKRDGRHMRIVLPSGRPIVYRNPVIQMLRAKVAGRPVGDPKPTVTYTHPRYGPGKVLFGGLVTENVCQGTARDLLVDAAERCEVAQPPIPWVLHVHDEGVAEVAKERGETDLKRMEAIMKSPPAWADGFPVNVKGYVAERYVKK